MKITAHVHSSLLEEQLKKEILFNCYLLLYFVLIVSANWELHARFRESIVSSNILYTIYASTKKE